MTQSDTKPQQIKNIHNWNHVAQCRCIKWNNIRKRFYWRKSWGSNKCLSWCKCPDQGTCSAYKEQSVNYINGLPRPFCRYNKAASDDPALKKPELKQNSSNKLFRSGNTLDRCRTDKNCKDAGTRQRKMKYGDSSTTEKYLCAHTFFRQALYICRLW